MRIGYFVIAFLFGTALAAAVSTAMQKPQPLPVLAAEGLAFAWAFSLFRAKVAKVVWAVMVFAAVKLGLTMIPDMVKDPSRIPGMPGDLLREKKADPKPATNKVQHKPKT